MELAGRDRRFRMRVDGMTCPSCERHVQKALRKAGARDVTADFQRGEALFMLDGSAEVGALAAAVEKAGYAPGPVEPVDVVAASDLIEYRMAVDAMTCVDCERHVVDALREAGAVEPSANFRNGEANFSAPTTIDPRRFADALTTTPYRARAIDRVTHERPEKPSVRWGEPERFDIAIVGSGGGAFAAAIAASENGARVVMIERGTLGGTCVNIGCIPSKTQLHAGELFWQAGHHALRGIRTEALSVDLPSLVDQKDQLVGKLRQEKYADLIAAYGWRWSRVRHASWIRAR